MSNKGGTETSASSTANGEFPCVVKYFLPLVILLTGVLVGLSQGGARSESGSAVSGMPLANIADSPSMSTKETTEGHLPLSWSLVMTDTERIMARTIKSQLPAMSPEILRLMSLPAVSGIDVNKVMHCIYSDCPELSVYTNGEYLDSTLAELLPFDSSMQEENLAEFETVTKRTDEMASCIENETQTLAETGERCGLSEDYVYALRVCHCLGRTTYSDGIDDTIHANDIYGALIDGESKCYGLASAAKALLDRRGIPSFVATGSIDGDPAKRHAVTLAWIDGQWRVLDITSIQGSDIPDAPCQAISGYWGGVAFGYDCYMQQNHLELDQPCVDLMRAYEEHIGIANGS